MYTLFWSPGSAAIAPHAMLEEIGAPFELVRVDMQVGAHKRERRPGTLQKSD